MICSISLNTWSSTVLTENIMLNLFSGHDWDKDGQLVNVPKMTMRLKLKQHHTPVQCNNYTVYPKKCAHGFCFAVFCCGYTLTDFPYPSGLLHWHCGNLTIAPVPAKQTWWIWINTSCEFIMNDCITTTKQSTTKPCAYFLGYSVLR